MRRTVPTHHLRQCFDINFPRAAGHAVLPLQRHNIIFRTAPRHAPIGTSLGWVRRGVYNGGNAMAASVASRSQDRFFARAWHAIPERSSQGEWHHFTRSAVQTVRLSATVVAMMTVYGCEPRHQPDARATDDGTD
ncbi:hypothetical protein APY04_1160 [Hyphomicrobium sulfonivorans]|uniref:Uncharacterized protein n=1 Tax=Hyphomicrobium sulfonivorans TaxID=121290 RepID=A0A109BJH0_HYPSL|nr:hypothetical protein APY04_1160 [Hyphomicrobium sulfonivorans]